MRTFVLKKLLLLFILAIGTGTALAEDYAVQWVKTSLNGVQSGDTILLVDEYYSVALPNNLTDFRGIDVTLKNDKIIGDVSSGIKWTITKNANGTLTFKRADGRPLAASSDANLVVSAGGVSQFTYDEEFGLLSCVVNNKEYFIEWNYAVDCWARLHDASTPSPSPASFSIFKRDYQTFVKWKKVAFSNIADNDELVIADLATANAMSNDKGADKAPALVSVELNADKDRITGDVPNNIKWKGKKGSGVSFVTPSNDTLMLIGKSNGLRVGSVSDGSSEFTLKKDFLSTIIDSKTYYAGVKSSFMSSKWELLEETQDGNVSDDIIDTQIAFFKKEVSKQKIVTLEFASDDFSADLSDGTVTLGITCNGAPESMIQWSSGNTAIATVSNGVVTLLKRGTVVITARIEENEYHDKALATCTLRIDDASSSLPGSKNHPFTVAQAKELAENGTVTIDNVTITLEEGCNYYIRGMVSKVNSGMLSMFGDLGLDEMMGGDMDMDEMFGDMDFDMDAMGDMGFDISSLIPGFGSSDGLTYYISDDGTKDNQLKVVNGHGVEIPNSSEGADVTFAELKDLSPGDNVVVCGPLIYTEDNNMFASLMGGSDNEEPKMSAKVGELNHLDDIDLTLLVSDQAIFVNSTKSLTEEPDFFYRLTKDVQGEVTIKTSDEEIASWDDEAKTLTGVQVGKAKITVKVKVKVAEDNPETTDVNEEKSYTMKRKFQLTVQTRDILPAGKNAGSYVLTHNVTSLTDGTRLLLVGTRVKDGESTHYAMSANNSMMGGGKGGNKVTIENNRIPFNSVPENTQEIVLEKEGDVWYLNVGQDEDGNNLYLYASDTSSDDEEDPEGSEGSEGFDISALLEMFMPGSGLKVATKEAAGDSCKAVIDITDGIATIQFPTTEGKKTIIKLASSFDMEEMMNMFGGEGEGGSSGGGSTSFDMGSFDFFMASFNTKAADDEKGIMPRIFRFVPDSQFDINIDESHWITIVPYNNVTMPEDLQGYVVTRIKTEEDKAIIRKVDALKGGEPYLLHSDRGGTFTLTLTQDSIAAPKKNLLLISDATTADSVFVLDYVDSLAAFYRWNGGLLGSGHVYLPAESSTTSDCIIFGEEFLLGDVNRDGEVDVLDVTALINMILGVLEKDQEVADVNADGEVDVRDVTMLINIILNIN